MVEKLGGLLKKNPAIQGWGLAPPDVEFLRGGAMKGGSDRSHQTDAQGVKTEVERKPRRFEWVDPEQVEVRWQQLSGQPGRTHLESVAVVRYKVAVTWDELTLTRVSDGVVFYYRRVP